MKFEDAIAEIKRRVDIASVVSRYVDLKKSGAGFMGVCPFHQEKTPSFSVRPDRGTFKCFGCGASGDLFSFIEMKTGQLFVDIVRKLASENHIVIDAPSAQSEHRQNEREELLKILAKVKRYYRSALFAPSRVENPLEYLIKSRGLPPDIIEKYELGWGGANDTEFVDYLRTNHVEKNHALALGVLREGRSDYGFFSKRIIIPIHDHRGLTVAFAGRAFGPQMEGKPKYINSPQSVLYEKSHVLYGLHHALPFLKQGAPCVLVEGYFDVIACHRLGFGAVAPCGTSLTEAHVQALSRYTKTVIVCFDQDPAGRAAQKKATLLLLKHGFHVKAASLKGKDPDEELLSGNQERLKMALQKAPDAILDLCQEVARIGVFGVAERIAALEALLPFLGANPSPLVNQQYVKLAAEILREDEKVLAKEVQKMSPSALKMPNIQRQKPHIQKRASWVFSERLLARALIAQPQLALSIDEDVLASVNSELSGFIERLQIKLLEENTEPQKALKSIPIKRDSELVGMLIESVRHNHVLNPEDAARCVADLAQQFKKNYEREQMFQDQRGISEAEGRGDYFMVKKVLTEQSTRLKQQQVAQMQTDAKEDERQPENWKNEVDSFVGEDFEELAWS